MKRYLFFTLLFIVLLASCSRKQKNDTAPDEERADIYLENTEYVISEDDQEPIFFKAKVLRLFVDSERMIMEDVEFRQKKQGSEELSISGKAGYIDLDTSEQNVSLHGNVELELHDDDGKINYIYAEKMTWSKYNRIIKADGFVSLKFDNSVIEGAGFTGDLGSMSFSFESIQNGVL